MAGSYVLPQVRVFQEFAETPNDVTQNLNPFVIGPNYQLIRYSDADTRAECSNGAYSGSAGLKLPWASGYSGSKVDTAWHPVTLSGAYVHLSSAGTALTPSSCIGAATGASSGIKFEFALGSGKTLASATSADKLHFGIPVKAGDYVAYAVTDGSKTVTKYSKIREISCGTLSSGEIQSVIRNKAGKAVTALECDATGYNGETDVTVTLTVTGAGTTTDPFKVAWSSTSDISGNATDLGTEYIQLGKGLKIKKSSTATPTLAAGTYTLSVKLIEPYSRDTITLTDFVPFASSGNASTAPTFKAFTFLRKIDDVELSEDYVSADGDGVTVSAGAKVSLGSGVVRGVFSATAYLTQRNLVVAHTDGIYSISTESDIIRELGAIDVKNPLAYALRIMLLNCANASIKYTAVPSDDYAGYIKALDRASVTSDVYAFCPLTEDSTIIESVVAHVESMSSPEEKSWRIAFFSKPTERTVDVTPKVLDVPEQCRVLNKILTCYSNGSNELSSTSKFSDTVRVGDKVVITLPTLEEVETKVVSVDSDSQLTLADQVTTTVMTSNCNFKITHSLDTAEYVSAVAATSTSFRNRRAYNVFPNTMRDSSGTTVSGIYGAAAVCALACSVAPQQPITNVEITGFSDLPEVYGKYNRDQLNEIASGGTLILMQDKVGGTVYVRHQISTAYADNNLNTTELSITKNLDSISYYFAARFAPYIGRYNLTDELLVELKAILTDGLAYLETSTETNRLIGPQIIAEGTEIRSIYRDTTEKDKAYANVALNLPAPFNNFDLRLQVI